MKDKLQLLIDSEENLTRSGLAKLLGINPATISQILAGRNNPSYELLQKILQRFTNLSADWLLLDREPMLRDPSLMPSGMPRRDAAPPSDPTDLAAATSPAASPVPQYMQSSVQPSPVQSPIQSPVQSSVSSQPTVPSPHSARSPQMMLPLQPSNQSNLSSPSGAAGQTPRESNISDGADLSAVLSQSRGALQVERVVVFYNDKTFETYIPKH